MSVTKTEEMVDRKFLIFNWKKTETTTICEGKVVHCRQIYATDYVDDNYKRGTALTLQKGNIFHTVYMTRLDLDEARAFLLGKNIRVKVNGSGPLDSFWYSLGMNNVELLAD